MCHTSLWWWWVLSGESLSPSICSPFIFYVIFSQNHKCVNCHFVHTLYRLGPPATSFYAWLWTLTCLCKFRVSPLPLPFADRYWEGVSNPLSFHISSVSLLIFGYIPFLSCYFLKMFYIYLCKDVQADASYSPQQLGWSCSGTCWFLYL